MKKRKIFKTLAFSSLAACMFCLPVLAGCAPAEMLPEKPTQGQNFDLGLNPETDPVVYTTQSGLEIKMSNANKFSGSVTTTSNRGNKYSQDLSSFYYFTMGTFSGTIYTAKTQTDTYTVTSEPVNWLIIGRGEMAVADSTPAGSAIQGDAGKQEVAFGNTMYKCVNFSSIPEHSDIPKGCFLVLSEKLLGKMYFNSTGSINYAYDFGDYLVENMFVGNGYYGNRYRFYGETNAHTGTQSWNTTNNSGGSLFNYINNLFSKNNSTGAIEGDNKLGFTKAQADLIVPQQLYTIYYDGTSTYQENPSTDKGTYYSMFPLADNSSYASSTYQNFGILDYLDSDAKRVACLIGSSQSDYWWLRSGSNTICRYGRNVAASGKVYVDGYNVCNSIGVRPAMVMKLS